MSEAPKRVFVDEIFGPTLQGEGPMVGMPVMFVRTGGCDYRCHWCDTSHAVLPSFREHWKGMSGADIFAKLDALAQSPMWVVLSGGNPALQPLDELIEIGHAAGYQFALETQGSIVADWFARIDHLTISPKPPSARVETDWDALAASIAAAKPGCCYLKVPVLDAADMAYVEELRERFPQIPLTLQPVNGGAANGDLQDDDSALHTQLMAQVRWLHEQVCERQWYDVRVLPQMHVMIWGTARGV